MPVDESGSSTDGVAGRGLRRAGATGSVDEPASDSHARRPRAAHVLRGRGARCGGHRASAQTPVTAGTASRHPFDDAGSGHCRRAVSRSAARPAGHSGVQPRHRTRPVAGRPSPRHRRARRTARPGPGGDQLVASPRSARPLPRRPEPSSATSLRPPGVHPGVGVGRPGTRALPRRTGRAGRRVDAETSPPDIAGTSPAAGRAAACGSPRRPPDAGGPPVDPPADRLVHGNAVATAHRGRRPSDPGGEQRARRRLGSVRADAGPDLPRAAHRDRVRR